MLPFVVTPSKSCRDPFNIKVRPILLFARPNTALTITRVPPPSIMSDQEAAPQSTQETSRAEVCDVLEAGIEEGVAAYHPSGFHPVYNGDIFNGRYQVLNKIGYGTYSTNWLVKDLNHKKG